MNRLQQIRFLQKNEKLFGALLYSLRKQIYVPDEVNKEYVAYLASATAMYSSVYYSLMHQQMGDALTLSMTAWEKINEPFVLAGRIPTMDFESFITTLFDRRLPNGYTLSQRVWDLRNYSDDIAQVIKNGMLNRLSPEIIARQLDGFILPNRQVQTLTPYGRTLNFDSLRLARTEIMGAFRKADEEMMRKSPWVTGLRWQLSGSHKDLCACDDLDGTIYSPSDTVPEAPHPQCACTLVAETMSNEEWNTKYQDYLDYGIDDDLGRIGSWLEGEEIAA